MNTPYDGLEPVELWRHFAALNAIPRPSGQEQAAIGYSRQTAEAAGATWKQDERGNLVVYVAGKGAGLDAPVVAIQAHLDMVCEKRPEVTHDFSRDPIRPYRDGDKIYASGTTLGADNGIGAAAALAVLTESDLVHGPLELVFTVEEETGLHGAMALDPRLISSRLLINLDSEDPKELTVGCAGGAGCYLRLPVTREPVPAGWAGREVVVAGLKGGHSGVQIHERLANAIKLLTRVLAKCRAASIPFRIVSTTGGNAHNAIPRDATALIAVAPNAAETLEVTIREIRSKLRDEWVADEPGLEIIVRNVDAPPDGLTEKDSDTLLRLLDTLPHGVLAMSQTFPGKVETSANLARVATQSDHVEIMMSYRSFLDSAMGAVQARIEGAGSEVGAKAEVRPGYPGWEPDPQSVLLQRAKTVYERMYGTAPQVQVIHAGLECGVIVSKIPGMEAISFGPSIYGAHTPEEHVSAPTVEGTWKLLRALLESLAH